MQPTYHVMTGLPACGKSTIIKNIVNDVTWIYSTDMYIEEMAKDHGLSYNEMFETEIKAATEFNERKVVQAMANDMDIVHDQTNLGKGKRAKIIKRAKNYGYRIVAHCIEKPQTDEDRKEWARRLNSREGKKIPANVLMNMDENYTYPTMEEGFDEVRVYTIYGKVKKVQTV